MHEIIWVQYQEGLQKVEVTWLFMRGWMWVLYHKADPNSGLHIKHALYPRNLTVPTKRYLICVILQSHYISPHSETMHGNLGAFPCPVAMFSIFLTTSSPSPRTRPNTTCLSSSQGLFAQDMKNCITNVHSRLISEGIHRRMIAKHFHTRYQEVKKSLIKFCRITWQPFELGPLFAWRHRLIYVRDRHARIRTQRSNSIAKTW